MGPDEDIERLCHQSKNLYNEANYLIRQEFFSNGEWMRYYKLWKEIKDLDVFKALPAQTAQQILRLLDKSWKSFFKAMKVWKEHPEKFEEKPGIPKYKKKDGMHVLIFTNQQVRIVRDKKNGKLVLSLPKVVGKNRRIGTRIRDKVKQVRIIPKGVGYVVEIVYDKVVEVVKKDRKDRQNTNISGIDLGSSNIVTMVNNIGKVPIVVKDNGKGIKSINQFYNKKKAEIQEIYDKQGIKTGKKLKKLMDKHNRKVNDYLHKLSRFIVNRCIDHKMEKLDIGYNPGWKQEIELGKRNNQNFVQIPFLKLIKMVEYKAEEAGIKVARQEESYTSKCSFLDDEPIEHHEHYLGKRIKRGLFRSAKGILINADVQGGYNTIKKSDPKAFDNIKVDGVGGCSKFGLGLHPCKHFIQ
jgi:IS605 OrfB family transposase